MLSCCQRNRRLTHSTFTPAAPTHFSLVARNLWRRVLLDLLPVGNWVMAGTYSVINSCGTQESLAVDELISLSFLPQANLLACVREVAPARWCRGFSHTPNQFGILSILKITLGSGISSYKNFDPLDVNIFKAAQILNWFWAGKSSNSHYFISILLTFYCFWFCFP